MSRRALITMTTDEVRAFLKGQRVVTVATIGPNGRWGDSAELVAPDTHPAILERR